MQMLSAEIETRKFFCEARLWRCHLALRTRLPKPPFKTRCLTMKMRVARQATTTPIIRLHLLCEPIDTC